jgi:hypothetical protein
VGNFFARGMPYAISVEGGHGSVEVVANQLPSTGIGFGVNIFAGSLTFQGNSGTSTSATVVSLQSVTGGPVTIAGNSLSSAGGVAGYALRSVTVPGAVTIQSNSIQGIGAGLSGLTGVDNSFALGGYTGIYADSVTADGGFSISDNRISNTRSAVDLDKSTATISGNCFAENLVGVRVRRNVTSATITGNDFGPDYYFAILSGSTGVTASGNYFNDLAGANVVADNSERTFPASLGSSSSATSVAAGCGP